MPEFEDATAGHPRRHDHEVALAPPPGEYAVNEHRWELDCDVCGYIGAADSEEEAWEMARNHSALRSVG